MRKVDLPVQSLADKPAWVIGAVLIFVLLVLSPLPGDEVVWALVALLITAISKQRAGKSADIPPPTPPTASAGAAVEDQIRKDRAAREAREAAQGPVVIDVDPED